MTVRGIGKPSGCKLIRLSAEVEAGIVMSTSIRGDFFAHPEEAFERAEARLCGCAVRDLGSLLDALLQEEGVEAIGVSGEAVQEVFDAALHAAEGEGQRGA